MDTKYEHCIGRLVSNRLTNPVYTNPPAVMLSEDDGVVRLTVSQYDIRVRRDRHRIRHRNRMETTGRSFISKTGNRTGIRIGNKTLFTVIRYLYNDAAGTASCKRTETSIYSIRYLSCASA